MQLCKHCAQILVPFSKISLLGFLSTLKNKIIPILSSLFLHFLFLSFPQINEKNLPLAARCVRGASGVHSGKGCSTLFWPPSSLPTRSVLPRADYATPGLDQLCVQVSATLYQTWVQLSNRVLDSSDQVTNILFLFTLLHLA